MSVYGKLNLNSHALEKHNRNSRGHKRSELKLLLENKPASVVRIDPIIKKEGNHMEKGNF